MALERAGREPRVVGRHVVAELPHQKLLIPPVLGDELLPDDITPLQRRDDERVDIPFYRRVVSSVLSAFSAASNP